MSDNNVILEMKNLHASYGSVPALHGVTLNVREGEMLVLVGRHGSGKTAILKTISGLLNVTDGDLLFRGHSILGYPPEKVVSLGISYVDEMRLLFPAMSVMDNLVLGAYHRYTRESREAIEQDTRTVFGLFPVLEERRKQYAGTLSGGEQQMLAIGRALMSHPRLLMLDCPTLGLAPQLVRKVVRAIARLRDTGVTILLIDQKLDQVTDVADRGYIVDDGVIVFEGAPKELMSASESRSYFYRKQGEGR